MWVESIVCNISVVFLGHSVVVDETREVSRSARRSCLVCSDRQLVSDPLADWQPVEQLT